jgi:hypothetical protein
MFATVSIITNTNVPTIMPCDHASRVNCVGSEGLAGRGLSMVSVAISPRRQSRALLDFCGRADTESFGLARRCYQVLLG